MRIGVLPQGDPGVFRSLLLPEVANAQAAGESVTALGLTQGDVAIGAVAGYLEDGRYQIASLYVAPDYRRCGGGRMLLEGLFDVLGGYALGVEISFTVTKEEHETLIPFLESVGFEREPDHGKTLYRTTLGEAVKPTIFAVGGKKIGTPFSQLDQAAMSALKKTASVNSAPVPEHGLFAKSVDMDLSMVCLNGSAVEAFLVFEIAGSGGLRLSALWSGSKNPALLPGLLRTAVTAAREKYPPETYIVVQAVNDASAALVRALLPGAKVVSHTYSRPLNLWI